MDSLTELYNSQIVPLDDELEKQAAEMIKQAEEEDAAGRIMARGFADELNKLAQDTIKPVGKAETIKSKPLETVMPKQTNVGGGWGVTRGARKPVAPPVKDISKGTGQFGKGKQVGVAGDIQKKPQ